jgi:HEPN domain-containing protein
MDSTAQQSCEKSLKALIAARGRAYDFTHNLEKLLIFWRIAVRRFRRCLMTF